MTPDEQLRALERAWLYNPSLENEDRYSAALLRARGYGLYPPFPTFIPPSPFPPRDENFGDASWLAASGTLEQLYQEDDYQGTLLYLFKYSVNGREAWCILPDSFGSCSGCDFWQGEPSDADCLEWAQALLRSAELRRWSKEDVKLACLATTEGYKAPLYRQFGEEL